MKYLKKQNGGIKVITIVIIAIIVICVLSGIIVWQYFSKNKKENNSDNNDDSGSVFGIVGEAKKIYDRNNLTIDGNTGSFSEGLAKISNDDGLDGYMDKQGNLVIDFQYDFASSFYNGVACVEKNEKYGFIDKQGNVVIDIQYDYADFNDNDLMYANDGLYALKKGDKWGYVDKQGNIVIDFQYERAFNFHSGLAVVNTDDNKRRLINTQGNVINNEYDCLSGLRDGLIVVEKDHKYGFIDNNGNIVIDFKYASVVQFPDGLAYVKWDDKIWGYIDKQGNEIIKLDGSKYALARTDIFQKV